MNEDAEQQEPEVWHALVCGLPLTEDRFELGSSIVLQRLFNPLSVFDLAAVGAVGFREWATLEPLAPVATAELISPMSAATLPGYDALNKCWLASALLVLRGFARHLCPAVSAYSWNFVAGHQSQRSETFRRQLAEEGTSSAVYNPRDSLPQFKGGLLDYHLRLLIPRECKETPFDNAEAEWFVGNLEKFNGMAAEDERFRFALEAAVDWRYAKDARSGISRLWAGIESVFGINSELVYRISLLASTIVAPRGKGRVDAFRRIKSLYGIRSKAVHGEPLTNNKLRTGLYESFDLLRLLLLDAVERGSVRTEEDYLRELLW
jgi:hypothetical protein